MKNWSDIYDNKNAITYMSITRERVLRLFLVQLSSGSYDTGGYLGNTGGVFH